MCKGRLYVWFVGGGVLDAPCKYAYMSGGYRIRPYANQKFDPFGAKINSMG